MTEQRMIDILAEVCYIEQRSLSADGRLLIMVDEALAAMRRAVEEEVARLKQCEAIVRELAECEPEKYQMSLDDLIYTARQWVRENKK